MNPTHTAKFLADLDKLVSVARTLLPVGVAIASHFIYNADSQHKLMVVTSDVDTITQLAGALAGSFSAQA